MDAGTAGVIAAIISAAASIAVAFITTRSRIGIPQSSTVNSSPAPASASGEPSFKNITERAKAKKKSAALRAIGWCLVALLYLMSVFLITFGVLGSVMVSQGAADPTNFRFALGFLFAGAFFACIGYWAQKRLNRHSD
jgi:hypothetical protein